MGIDMHFAKKPSTSRTHNKFVFLLLSKRRSNLTLNLSEENVWKLCEKVKISCPVEELKRCHVVFISNSNQQIPLWHQKASTNEQRLVMWDYHVIMVYAKAGGSLVYDLDTELSFPCSFLEYASACIGEESVIKKDYWRQFRVIDAKDFISKFASDRSHMLKEDGSWLSPAPSYPPIQTKESTNNLQKYISMEESNEFGNVFNFEQFKKQFLNS